MKISKMIQGLEYRVKLLTLRNHSPKTEYVRAYSRRPVLYERRRLFIASMDEKMFIFYDHTKRKAEKHFAKMAKGKNFEVYQIHRSELAELLLLEKDIAQIITK